MGVLAGYLFRLFTREALGVFALIISILFLVQTLQFTDSGALGGGSVLTGLLIILFNLSATGIVFLGVSLVMGLGRGLRTLVQWRELSILHAGRRFGALFGAAFGFLVAGTLLVLVLSHEVAPLAIRSANLLRAEAAADLVNRTLRQNSFGELSPGVTVSVTGRKANGQLSGFFADDRRTDPRRTYLAETALIARDEQGYVIRLENGRVQYLSADGRFSEMGFARYDITLENLTDTGVGNEQRAIPSHEFLRRWAAGEALSDDDLKRLADRTADGLRVLVLGLLVIGIGGFPDGRRRPPLFPIEIVVLAIALAERAGPALLPGPPFFRAVSGLLLVAAAAIGVLGWRLWPFPFARRAAP